MILSLLVVECRAAPELAKDDSRLLLFGLTSSFFFFHLLQPTWITQCPLLLLDTRMPYGSLSMGCEERLDPAGTGSLYNEGEADIVVNHVISLIYAGE
ncbi:hypothetical protein F2Q69_00015948 [Brassica cretica]|uniref:Uncharacterized protein n=1 Tax=Brassica cretica TaxID=69181 RepID=A0A8S9R8H9_BRACR|nr:hypothetical protein F2Q69_00015948 [Brassica cretica]